MEKEENPVIYSPCLICTSLIITPPIKAEPEPDLDQEEDNKSVISFVLKTLLEIPESEVEEQQEDKLIKVQFMTVCCDQCIKLICSARTIYTDILKLTQKFRKVQKQIVNHISNKGDLQHSDSSPHFGILDFCRNFLNKHDFNSLGYPFVVKEIQSLPEKNPSSISLSLPRQPKLTNYTDEELELQVDKVKEESISEDENDDCGVNEDNRDEEYTQDSEASSADENSKSESDSDFEPPPPPKNSAKKIPIKKSSSSSSQKINRKSPSSSSAISKPPRQRKKPIPPKKQSRFDLLYPDYPKRIRDPFTKMFQCLEPACSKMYSRKTRLETHAIIQHLQDNYFKCKEPSCGKSYSTMEPFQDHVSWHAGIPRWKCEEKVTTATTPDGGASSTLPCTEAFFCRKKLVRHVQQVHHNDKPFICEICGKTFSCQDYLTGHKFMKHTAKGKQTTTKFFTPTPQICNYCGKSYSSKQNLEMHINLAHETTDGKFPCEFCERRFKIRTHLKMHMFRKHEFCMDGYQPRSQGPNRYLFHCNVRRCKMNFVKEETYKKHMEERHGQGKEDVYEFSCKFCGKGFHAGYKLEYHEEAHRNKESKPFSCEICGRRFARMPYLKIHKKNIHKIPMDNARKKDV